MLQSLESPSFAKSGNYFVINNPVSVSHVTPSTLKTVLHELITISKVYEDVKCMTEALVDRAGTVVQRLKYEAENLLS